MKSPTPSTRANAKEIETFRRGLGKVLDKYGDILPDDFWIDIHKVIGRSYKNSPQKEAESVARRK